MFKLYQYDRQQLYNKFMAEEPINHLVFDNFVDEYYLSNVLTEIKQIPTSVWDNLPLGINREEDNIYFSKKTALSKCDDVGPYTREIFNALNSQEMMKFLEDITGIKGLLPDPSYLGGGIHRIKTGGRLGIHCDFNIHPQLQKYRRLNVLIYLNKDWKPSYNGEFEFWNETMTERTKSVPPIFNRMVLFRINDTAYHGHPIPWEGPEGCERLSLAAYYYTEDRPESEKAPFHWAQWQRRYNIDY
jgi:Rps23 Pro-64 3,4-dihydroxylase Tpa1-like proline 4-hydroxylase